MKTSVSIVQTDVDNGEVKVGKVGDRLLLDVLGWKGEEGCGVVVV